MIANLPRLDPERPLGHACAMDPLPPPITFLVLVFAGWVNRQQQAVIDYLLEENRVLRAAHGPRRLHLTDESATAPRGERQGARPTPCGHRRHRAPDTILRWYRTLVAKKEEI